MRNPRYFIATIAALILITVSIVFISIWGYRTFLAGSNTTVIRDTLYVQSKDTVKEASGGDALRPVVNDPSLEDTVALQQKLAELEQLQSEIKTLLENRKNPDSVATDEKIRKLENDIRLLEKRNQLIIAHNRRLERTVTRLVKPESTPPKTEENESVKPVTGQTAVTVSSISLYALNNDLAETSDASGTDILRGSFFVKAPGANSGELMVVVTGPSGNVLINAPWESGYFDTPDGRKLYSIKLRFEKPEQRLNFSLNTENLKRGTYILQIYFKGSLVATLRKSLA